MKILGIETSCDETAAAVVESGKAFGKDCVKVVSEVVSSQIKIHQKYGGVVPEVAAREHVLNILPVINEALLKAGINRSDLISKKGQAGIDAIAVTVGPGLLTSLMTGVETAKVLSYAWNIPVVAVNHIEGHIYANFVEPKTDIEFPALVLTVSGGHTMLVHMEGHGAFETIGETRDDAAGEAFDKAAKLMDVGYPGGPIVSQCAERYLVIDPELNNKKIVLPRPMLNSSDFDFSFSGLKTAIRYELEKDKDWRERIPEYCHEFQQAVVDVLIKKTIKAAIKQKARTVMLCGGVSANKELRRQLELEALRAGLRFAMPDLKYTTDNAVMIAAAGCFKAGRGEFTEWRKLGADCNLGL